MKLTFATLGLLAFPLLSLAAPKEAYEMVNKVNGVVVRTDILVKEGNLCKVYSKDLYETFITMYDCRLDTTKFTMGSEKISSCYAESSGQAFNRTYEADQHFNVHDKTENKIELKSRDSHQEYQVTVTLKKIDFSRVAAKVGDSHCIF